MKEKYSEMKMRHQKEVDALPLLCAFSNAQLEEECEKYGVKDPKSELVRMGCVNGVFYRKVDANLINETFARHKREKEEAMHDEEFAVSAFDYEAANHELIYSYTPDDDMAYVFGFPVKKEDETGCNVIDWNKVENGAFLKGCYVKGVSKYYERMREYA